MCAIVKLPAAVLRREFFLKCFAITLVSLPCGALANDFRADTSFSLFGRPGIIDLPTSVAAADGTLAFSYTYAENFTRNSIFFQYAPWGSVTLRYGGEGPVGLNDVRPTYDRSIDFAFNLLREGKHQPSLSIGFQDIIGTGIYAGEYLALGKAVANGRVHLNAGLGWGRLASNNSFENPLANLVPYFGGRPAREVGRGGRPYPKEWFRGEVSPFFGVSFQATDKLTLKAEYSSDDYSRSQRFGSLTPRSPFNLSASYAFSPALNGQISLLQGDEFAFGITVKTGVKNSATVSSRLPAPPFVFTGESDWTPKEYVEGAAAREKLGQIATNQGMRLVSFDVDGAVARVAFENLSFDAPAQAFGRMARWLTFVVPPAVEYFELTAVRAGMPVASVTIPRSDLAEAEHSLFGPETLAVSSSIEGPGTLVPGSETAIKDLSFKWGLSPYAQVTLFDPDDPRRTDLGLQLDLLTENGLGWQVGGSFRQRLTGNRSDGRLSNSVLPHVRTDQVLYDRAEGPTVEDLWVAKYRKLSPNVYGRLTAGYLERMYAGISAEALWAPFDTPWSIGLEANVVSQRDYDGLFGLRDYNVFTGHVTGQYTLASGAYANLAVGQYLAGDVGGTITLGRTFKNGWDLSAYATFTNVSFDDFGEGSFDKGIRLEIPIAALFGMQSRARSRIEIRSITRDGGARLKVPGRLSEFIEGYRKNDLEASWPRVLR